MKAKIALLLLALGASTCLVNAQDSQPPSGTPPPPQRDGGPGDRGGFHLLPPRAAERLNLTDDQKKQIVALEAETKAKLEKILTPEQMEQLKNMRPPMRGGGPGGQNGSRRGPGDNNSGAPQGQPPGDNGSGNNPPSGPPPSDN